MKISRVTIHNTKRQSVNLEFGANLAQISKKLTTAQICPCKINMIRGVVDFFEEVQKQFAKIVDSPKEFIYKLGEKNSVPEPMKEITVKGLTIEAFDKILTENSFRCASGDCFSTTNKGGFIAELFEKMGLENPKVISINATNNNKLKT